MGNDVVESVEAALRKVRDKDVYIIWLKEEAARQFKAPGWEELLPHRDGAVLFINRYRQERLRSRRRPT